MSFQNTSRIFAIAPADVAGAFAFLLAKYGEEIADGSEMVRTIGAHWDDSGMTRKRAASLTDGTITGQALTDGRVAFRALWQSDLAAEFDANGFAGVAELTEAEVLKLTPDTNL